MLTPSRVLANSELLTLVRFRILPISTEVNRILSSSLPIPPVLIGIGSKFSLRIALSVQFRSFQASETTFFCGIHGGFVYVVQLKLKEVKSGCFIHFTIHHKNTLYRVWTSQRMNQHGGGFECYYSVSGIH